MCIYWRAVVLIVRKSTSAALTPQKHCTAEIDAMAWQLRQLRVEPRAMVRPRSCLRIPQPAVCGFRLTQLRMDFVTLVIEFAF